eukprot:symbB.v1.2.034467.t2/scaffold4455.1/size39486/2
MYFSFVIPFLLAVSGQECDQCEVRSKSLLQAALKAQRQDDLDLSQAYGIPRHDLTNLRVPLHTEIQTTNMGQANQFQDHNECHASTPDGRLYLCGEKKKFLRYFKFESMTFTDDGVPIWNDGSWNLWPSQLDMKDMNKAAFCYPDWHRPFAPGILKGSSLSKLLFGPMSHHHCRPCLQVRA